MSTAIPTLSIVIPAKNEEKRIIPTIQSIKEYIDTKEYEVEVIVVENQSTDNTVGVVQAFAKSMPGIRVISLGKDCKGKGCAVKEGIIRASAPYVVFMDADNATRITEMDTFLPELERGTPVVIGSRHVKGAFIEEEQPLLRQLIGRLANLLIQVTVLWGIKDTQCGFKAFHTQVAKQIFSVQTIQGWGFDIEVLAIAKSWGVQIKELPVHWYHVGESRLRPIRAALTTLSDLATVRIGLWAKKYPRPQSTQRNTGK